MCRRRSVGWVEFAIGARTLALQAVSPLERLLPSAWGDASGAPLPPLWLRRHAGPVGAFRSAAEGTVGLLERLELLRPGLALLDFGCGPGSLLPLLAPRLGSEGRYLGLDIHAPSIRWCREAWAHDVRFRFEELGLSDDFKTKTKNSIEGKDGFGSSGAFVGPGRGSDALAPEGEAGGWPAVAGGYDLVLAKSVFTHLLEPEAVASLAEIRRCLAPSGRAVVTAFLFDGAAFAGRVLPWFRHPAGLGDVRWRRAARPTAAVAYERGRFSSLVGAAGLEVENFVRGYFPGGAPVPTGQDLLVLRRRAGVDEGSGSGS